MMSICLSVIGSFITTLEEGTTSFPRETAPRKKLTPTKKILIFLKTKIINGWGGGLTKNKS